MDSRYLRVKNWGDLQHYRDKEPKWIKAYAKLLHDGRFQELDEPVQYQLFRIWLVASQSSRFTFDETGRRVPVVAYDERTLRRAIKTLKKIPLEMFVREGWLVPVAEEELDDESLSRPALDAVSRPALEKPLSRVRSRAPSQQRGREVEQEEPQAGLLVASNATTEDLPFENELLTARLIGLIGSSGDEHTPQVVRSYARRLPPASLVKVIESVEKQPRDSRARYAVGALKSELNERSAA